MCTHKGSVVAEGIVPECHGDRWLKYKNKEGKIGNKIMIEKAELKV